MDNSGGHSSSSRLIVKGLPNKITENRLRELFSSHGTVTDCQLKFRPADGKFRKFAFVGFADESEATSAKEYYHNTFVDTSRIMVEFCRKMGDEASQQKSKAAKQQQQQQKSEQSKSSSLAVEISGFSSSAKKKSLAQFFAPIKPIRMRISRNSESVDGGTALIFLSKRSEVQALLGKSGKYFGGCKVTVRNVASNDERILKKRPKNDDGDESVAKEKRIPQQQQTADECVEKISETGRLFVRNLPYVCSVEEIESVFKSYGPLADVKLPMTGSSSSLSLNNDDNDDQEKSMKKPKGIALVTFVFPEHALKAYSELDGTIYKGRMLHIIAGEEKAEDKKVKQSAASEDSSSKSFKTKKALRLKSTSGQSYNWNALFLSPNAVADVLTERLETEKSALLNPEKLSGGDLSVRMALGESSLVRETREFLLENGVSLDCFSRRQLDSSSSAPPRSKRVILVKNLPAGSTAEELRERFEKFGGGSGYGSGGSVARIVLPPSGISALVEMLDEQEAKKAFKSLAYSRFKTAPLYLEWAPGDVFTNCKLVGEESAEIPDDRDQEKKEKEEPPDAEAETVEEEGTTLFVKNLNFETDDHRLAEYFKSKIGGGPLVYANVAKKRNPAKSGGFLSMGFGFVRFRSKADAKRALKECQGKELDGFALQLKLSERQLGGSSADSSTKSKKRSLSSEQRDQQSKSETKILVRNIPFQARQSEIESLFKTFGDLRFARLPKKSGGDGHRGFGFVDFVSKSDARKAFDALCHSTHLYGRRLVLEWATTQEDTVEEMQKKTANRFLTSAIGTGRRQNTKKDRIHLDDDDDEQKRE